MTLDNVENLFAFQSGWGGEVKQQAFCDHQCWGRTTGLVHGATLYQIIQVDCETLTAAARGLAPLQLVIVIPHIREADLNPP